MTKSSLNPGAPLPARRRGASTQPPGPLPLSPERRGRRAFQSFARRPCGPFQAAGAEEFPRGCKHPGVLRWRARASPTHGTRFRDPNTYPPSGILEIITVITSQWPKRRQDAGFRQAGAYGTPGRSTPRQLVDIALVNTCRRRHSRARRRSPRAPEDLARPRAPPPTRPSRRPPPRVPGPTPRGRGRPGP